MSNINQLATLDEQLFTELTPEQSEIVAGGLAKIRIVGLQCIKAGADTFGADDTYITVNGKKLGSTMNMDTGSYKELNLEANFRGGMARVNLFDSDTWLEGSDDYMGGFKVTQVGGGLRSIRVSGGGSTYDVYYGTYEAPDF